MKIIKVVTYCEWDSYGSVLQSFGLKKKLNSMNCDVEHIRFNSISDKKLKVALKGKSLKKLLINLHRYYIYGKLKRRYNLTMRFLYKHFRFCTFNNYEQLKENTPFADAYIAGSDQIWHPNAIKPYLYLDFVKDYDKKIAYAASMGVTDISDSNITKWYDMVDGFKHISVREQEVKDVINKKLDRDVRVHIDPTFLVDKKEWRDIEKKYPVKGEYILVYPLFWDTGLNAQLKELHKKTGLPVVAIVSKIQTVYANKRIYDASIEEFLWLFDNASYIVTSSFHGAAFSIIFEKKFSAVINPNKPSRLTSLLNTFEIDNTNIIDLAESNGPNYDKVRKIILNERERANEYLSKAIGKE